MYDKLVKTPKKSGTKCNGMFFTIKAKFLFFYREIWSFYSF